ncbi:MAG: hypothetical protein ACSHWZ_19005 [Sulfitobacter sp.]
MSELWLGGLAAMVAGGVGLGKEKGRSGGCGLLYLKHLFPVM